jgi:hypothetical protein
MIDDRRLLIFEMELGGAENFALAIPSRENAIGKGERGHLARPVRLPAGQPGVR